MRELTKEELTELILFEMAEYDLVDVPFWWDQSKRKFGRVHWDYYHKLNKYKIVGISLSEPLFNGLEDKWHMVDTIYHELAHVVAIRKYNDPHHTAIWKRIARKLGASPKSCHHRKVDRSKMNYKYTATCRFCGYDLSFARLGKVWARGGYTHSGCGGGFNIEKNY